MHEAFEVMAGKTRFDLNSYTADGQRHASAPLVLSRLSALVSKAPGVSDWPSIDRPSINAFADFAGDCQSNAGIACRSGDVPQISTFECTLSNTGA